MESGSKQPSFATRAVQASSARHGDVRAIAPPIYLSTTFERDEAGAYSGGFEYARESNPNRAALEAALAELEGGAGCAAFASGSAATMAVFQALRPGDHAVVANDAYWGVRVMLDEIFAPWGLAVSYADCTDIAAIEAAIRPATRLIFIETPANPKMGITDIAAAAALAHEAGALLACDNTLPTPVLQQPLALGADLVLHATTKALSGNHDAMGGAVVTARDDAFWARIRLQQKVCGAIPSPFASWLTLRGIGSLVQRVRWQNDSALAIAQFLAQHPAVLDVLHPGLPSHPGYEVATKQMTGVGGLFSFRVLGGRDEALAVSARVRRFRRATSFGGAESLIEHRASVEGPKSTTPDDLLRLAIGLEDPADLIADLDRALNG
jgi:cystathionine gamma-synthase